MRDRNQDEIDVLVSVDVFIEGLDIPRLNSVFLCRPTFSHRVFLQMVGRGLRGPAVGGTPQCILVNCVDDFVAKDNQKLMDFDLAHHREALLSTTDVAPWQDEDGDEEDSTEDGAEASPGDEDDEDDPVEDGVEASSRVDDDDGLVDFLELDIVEQAKLVWGTLLYQGRISKIEAIPYAARKLRANNHVAFERLDPRGKLWACIEAAMSPDLKEMRGHYERTRSAVKAIVPNNRFEDEHWIDCVRHVIPTTGRWLSSDDLIQQTVTWAVENVGLNYQRLSRAGWIWRGIAQAIVTLRRSGELPPAEFFKQT